MQEKSTAILLFSQNAEDDFDRKSFGLNYQRFSKVHQALVNKVRHTLFDTGLPVYEADSRVQQGNDFGSRLLHAIEWVKAHGHTRLIIVGNDSPGLVKKQIIEAEKALVQGKSVLGKDIHGGAYLIGLDTIKEDLSVLSKIDWHSNRVYDQLKEGLCQVEVLSEVQADINDLKDWKRLSTVKSLKSFLRLISHLINPVFIAESRKTIRVQPKWLDTTLHRGPPALA